MNQQRFEIVMSLLAGALIFVIFGWLFISYVNASPSCATLREARNKWEGKHLWWYKNDDGRKCWSNRKGGPPRIKASPSPQHVKAEADPEPEPAPAPPPAAVPIEQSAFANYKPMEPVAATDDLEATYWPAYELEPDPAPPEQKPVSPEKAFGYVVMMLGVFMVLATVTAVIAKGKKQ